MSIAFRKEKAYLIPVAPLAFAPHRQTRSSETPYVENLGISFRKTFPEVSATGGPTWIKGFYPYPCCTSHLSRSQGW